MHVAKVFFVASFLCAILFLSMCSALGLYVIFSKFGLYGKFIGYVVGTLTWILPAITFLYKFSILDVPFVQSVQSKIKRFFIAIAMLATFPLVAELIPTTLLTFIH